MTVSTFTAPWNWGKSLSLSSIIHYSLSDINGKLYTWTGPINSNDWTSVPATVSCAVTAMAGKFKKSNDTTSNIADA